MRVRHLAFALLLGTASAALAPTSAHARPPGVSYRQWVEAKRLFNQGHLAYEDGNYEEAILKWKRSYQLSKQAKINDSISKAYERLGDPDKALEYLRVWYAAAPTRTKDDREARKNVKTRIQNLERRVAEKRAKEAKAQKEKDAAKAREEKLRREKEAAERKRQEKLELDEAGSGAKIAGWTMVGVGGAAVIAGIVMDAVAAGSRPDEAAACVDQAGTLLCRDSMRDDIESSNTLAIAGDVTWIVGAAVAATGVVVAVVLEPPKDDGLGDEGDDKAALRELKIAPAAGRNGAGLMFSGTF